MFSAFAANTGEMVRGVGKPWTSIKFPSPRDRGATDIISRACILRPAITRSSKHSSSHAAPTVSLYAMRNLPMRRWRFHSRTSLSRMMSRWSSPIPLTRVCPVSDWTDTWKLGSSRCSALRAISSCACSVMRSASTPHTKTGSGTTTPCNSMGLVSLAATNVSPVRVSFRPISAPMFPALIEPISVTLSAKTWTTRPTRSLIPRFTFNSIALSSSVPE
mmetsp:Transcript_2472/g.4371  ORF Transcript_2472/g.4371 Transcript_2472/m.4371 type:complete len:218 (-) Transcript_2472:701-1354(-)